MRNQTAPSTLTGVRRLRALTVLELVAVSLCVGILAIIGALTYSQIRANSQNAAVKLEVEQTVRNAQAIARSGGAISVGETHLQQASDEMSSTQAAALFFAASKGMVIIPDLPAGGQAAGAELGVDYGPSMSYGTMSYMESGTLLGVAARSESGDCVFGLATGVENVDVWLVNTDLGAECRGGNALAGYQDPATYSYSDPLSYGSPAQVIGLTFDSATDTTADVSWTASTASDLAGYFVYVNGSLSSGATPLTSTSYTITGLSPNSLYTVRVSAVDIEPLEGLQSDPVNAITSPATPTGLAATAASDTEINISWNNQAYSTFRLYINSNIVYTGTATSYDFTTADPATTYSFQIDATNVSGGSPVSSAVNATTFPAGVSSFAFSAADSDQSSIGLTWTASDGVITGYKIYRDSTTSPIATIVDPAADSYVDTGRTSGASHTYYIRNYNATGDGTLSSSVSGYAVPADPSTPSSNSHTTSGLTVTWGSVSGATSYQLYRNASLINTASSTSYADSGLTAGTNYSYQVKACNLAGCSGASASHGGITKPASVTGFAVDAKSSAVDLSWTESVSPVLSGYKIYYKASTAASYTLATSIAGGTSYQVASLTPGVMYNFKVAAYNASGETDSAVESVAPYTVPAQPAAPTLSNYTTSSMDISWTAPTDGGTAITGYQIYRGASVIATVGAGTTSYGDTSLSSGTNYSYQIVAQNIAGSSPISAATSAPTLPAAATAVAAAPGNQQVTVSWTNSTSPVVTGHKVYYRAGTTGSYTLWTSGSSSTSPVTITGLTNGTTYQVYVSAYNASGATDSATDSALARTVPTQMAAPSLSSISLTGMTVTWTAPTSDGGSAITGYNVYRNSVLAASVGAGTTSQAFTGLTAGTNYSFQVEAVNVAGSSPLSTSSDAPTLPAAPTGLLLSPADNTMDVSWTDSSSPVVSGHKVYYRAGTTGAFTEWTPLSDDTTPTTITGLSNGSAYEVYVAAYNESGATNSASSSAVPRTVPSQLDAPSLSSITLTGMTVTWTAPTSDGGSAVTGYNVYRGGSLVASVGAGTTSQAVTGLTAGTNYSFQVEAVNVAGSSPISSATVAPTLPAAATAVAGQDGYEEVAVSWTNSVSPVVSGYKVYYRAGTSGAYTEWTPAANDTTPTTVTGLTGKQLYSFKVVAHNASGSTESSVATATPYTIPSAPGTPTFSSATTTSITVAWTAPDDDGGSAVTSYEVVMNGTLSQSVSGTTTTATFSTLTAGTNYSFTVRAQNAASWGAYSSSGVYPTLPAAATAVAAAPGNQQVTVSWTNSVSPVVSGYKVYYRAGTSGAYTEWTAGTNDTTPTIITGLTNGTTYQVYVSAYNASGATDSATDSALARTVPSQVAAPSLDTFSLTGMTISWSAPTSDGGSAITGYYVYRGTSQIASVGAGTTSYADSDLTAGTNYSYQIVAYNIAGSSAISAATSAPTLPAAATAVAAASGDSQVSFSWTNSVSPVVSGYKVYYRAGTSGAYTEWTAGTNDTTPTIITGLTNGTTYQVYVSAYNASGATDSATDSALARTTPDAPTGLTLSSVSTSSATFAWTAPATGGSAISSYDVYRNASLYASAAGTATSYTDSSVSDGTTYSYTLVAKNIAGSSPTSSALSITTRPAAATDVSGTATPGSPTSITVSWTDSTSTVVAGHKLYYRAGTSGSFTEWTTGTDDTSGTAVSGLVAGTSYYFRVDAYVNNGGTAYETASTIAGPVTAITTPAQVSSLTPSSGDASVSVSWSSVASTPSAPVSGYKVYSKLTSSTTWSLSSTTTGTSALISGLSNGSSYDFRVVSYNVAGESLVTSTTSTPYTTPAAPSITGTTFGYAQISVTFTAGSNGGNAISSYTAYVYDGSNNLTTSLAAARTGSTQTITVPATNSLTVGTSGTSYTVKVSATNDAGESALSTGSTGTVYSVPSSPGTPTLSSRASGSITMAWTAATANYGSSITGYRLDAFTSSTATATSAGNCTAASTATSCTVSGLDNATTYYFRSRAENAAGFSAYSSASTGYNPATIPDTPAATGSYAYAPAGNAAGAVSITVGIPAVADNGSTVTGGTAEAIRVSDSVSVGTCTVSGALAGSCNITSLNPQVAYSIRTKRTNGMGDSSWYTVGSITAVGKPTIGTFSFTTGTPTDQAFGEAQYKSYAVNISWGTVAYNGSTAGASPFSWACTINTSPTTSDSSGTGLAAASSASYNSNYVTSSGNGAGNTTATSRTCTLTASATAPANAVVGDTAVSTASTTVTSATSTSTVSLPGYAAPYPGHYPAHYPAHYPTHYSGHYPTHYSGHYPTHYGGHYPTHYGGHYPTHYGGHYPTHYGGHYPAHYGGHYPAHYGGHYPAHYGGHYPRHYPSHYGGHYPTHYGGHYPRHYPSNYYPPNLRRY